MLTHPQCGPSCKLQSYLDIIHPLIPVDWKKECQLNFDDDLEDFDEKNHNKNVLKNGLPKITDDWFTPESSCFLNPSR